MSELGDELSEVAPEYLAGVKARLDPLYRSQRVGKYDPGRDRIVVFSDHHRGVGDGADDFRHCEFAYCAALGYYLEAGYELYLLGDVEELWEVSRPSKIVERYAAVMELERQFDQRSKLIRFWGNHDDRWLHPDAVDRDLRKYIGQAPMQESLRLDVARADGTEARILFVHGHQGTPGSDRFSGLARLPVRYVWPLLQKLQGATATTPARDHELRGKHDRAMFEWARQERGRVLVAGHTHRPVFAESTPPRPVTPSVRELEAALHRAHQTHSTGEAMKIAIELEYAYTLKRRPNPPISLDPPCYFNTGCCSFPDGDITGIELADGQLRLVRWPGNLAELRPTEGGPIDPKERVLATADLDETLDAVCNPPDRPSFIERPLVT